MTVLRLCVRVLHMVVSMQILPFSQKICSRSRAAMWACGVAVLAGCTPVATTPQPTPEVDVFADLPSVVPAAQTTETQRRGGVTITVAPTHFDTVGRTVCKYREPQASLFTIAPSGATLQTHRKLLEIEYHDIDVTPPGLTFLVTIRNGMNRVFRGSGAVVTFNVDSRVQAVEQSSYMELLNVLIPPGGEAQVHISGPALPSLNDGTTLGLFLYDVVTAIDNAGTVTHRDNFEWFFRVGRRRIVEKSTLVATNVWVPRPLPPDVAEEVPGGGLRLQPNAERCLVEGVVVEGQRGVPQARPVSTSAADGQAADQQGSAEPAARTSPAAVASTPSYATSMAAGVAAAREGRTAEAIREFENAYRLNAFHRDILYNLARLYILDSAYAKGIAAGARLVAIDPANPDNYQLLAIGYAALNKQLRTRTPAGRPTHSLLADSIKATGDSALKYERRKKSLAATVTFSEFTPAAANVTATATVVNNGATRRSFRVVLTYLDVSGAARAVDTLVTGPLAPKASKTLSSVRAATAVAGFKYRIQ